MMQDSEIRKLCEEVEEYCSKATPGPWTFTEEDYGDEEFVWYPHSIEGESHTVFSPDDGFAQLYVTPEQARHEATFVTRARTDLPKLVAALREKIEAERWIPVSERLPEIEKAVWVWADGAPRVAMRSNPENEGWLWYFSQCGWDLLHGDFEMEDATVTHWRPLPSAPEVKA